MHTLRSFTEFINRRPEAVVHKHSEGAIKDPRVYKFVDSTVHVNDNFRLYKLIY